MPVRAKLGTEEEVPFSLNPGETSVIVPATKESLGRAAQRYMESRAFADAFLATWEMYGTAANDGG